MTIGQRAAQAIRVKSFGRSLKSELDVLDIKREAHCNWENGKYEPQAYALQQMALAGYDVLYILTGRKSGE